MGIHFNHKSKAGDRKMQKALKLKRKAEEEKARLAEEEEMRKLEELTRPDKYSAKKTN